jgi:hypothetical protein
LQPCKTGPQAKASTSPIWRTATPLLWAHLHRKPEWVEKPAF